MGGDEKNKEFTFQGLRKGRDKQLGFTMKSPGAKKKKPSLV